MRTLRIGFVGAGEQGINNLLPALLQVSGARVAAVCDQNVARGQVAAALAGSVAFHEDPKTMIDRSELDAVVMACPPRTHCEIAHYAMERGLHVFVEKPPCVTTKELVSLVAVARNAGLVTGVGLNFRFALGVQRFREILRNPMFGDLVHLHIMHAANKPRAPMWETDSAIRSFMLAQAIHSVDLALDLGGPVEKVDVAVREKNKSSLIQVEVTHAGAVTSSLLTGSAFPAFTYEMLAVGSQGHMIRLENFWELTLLTEGRQGQLIGDGKRWREAWHPSPLESGYVRSGYFGELQTFVNAIQKEERFVADYESLLPTYQIIDTVVSAGQRATEKTRATASGEVAHA